MTRVDENRLKGNYAENIVAAWLSRSCLVRPVAEGTDIGVDLYCESVIDSTPYLHFWAQVKAVNSSHIRTIDGKEEAWFDFDVKHLQYWARQPIPVYAFLVPIDEWPPSEPKRVYGIKITEFVVKNEIKDEGTIRLTSGGWWDASSIDEDIHQFVTKIVSWDASANLVQRGIIAPIQTAQKESQERFPTGIGFRHLEKILDNIRDASVMGLMDSLAFERVDPTKKHIRKKFESVLRVFADQLHNLGFSMLIRSAHEEGRIDDAISLIEETVKHVNADDNIKPCDKKRKLNDLRILLDDFREYL